MNGFLFIDKPVGPTSHDMVARVRRSLHKEHPSSLELRGMIDSEKDREQVRNQKKTRIKVGHAGTLDPLASGLLILGVGSATKQLGRLVGLDKRYETTIKLGATSTTDDAEGALTAHVVQDQPRASEIEKVLKKFLGEQHQVPPAFSAKKMNGVRSYQRARRGETVPSKPHSIVIYDLRLTRYKYPELELHIHCSSGTYVRALARDIGAALRTGGYVHQLRRTTIGPFVVEEASEAIVPVSLVLSRLVDEKRRNGMMAKVLEIFSSLCQTNQLPARHSDRAENERP